MPFGGTYAFWWYVCLSVVRMPFAKLHTSFIFWICRLMCFSEHVCIFPETSQVSANFCVLTISYFTKQAGVSFHPRLNVHVHHHQSRLF